ncbi:hypothetical protein SEA_BRUTONGASTER_5 [Gordonia phage BrutonGaster]|uniref:Uncharacterized protein n=1 Tax=Gordonia phage BrutonGaster TaxID=2530116 RepID=A0A482JLH8_9CAUD|nr:hypothetical protein HOV26_gp005 [Gordonia phage BrutonGaster]QBP33227.1 hypothetical protein SEA_BRUTONGASTER_5 [Gordonia phage BrutonGaster]
MNVIGKVLHEYAMQIENQYNDLRRDFGEHYTFSRYDVKSNFSGHMVVALSFGVYGGTRDVREHTVDLDELLTAIFNESATAYFMEQP